MSAREAYSRYLHHRVPSSIYTIARGDQNKTHENAATTVAPTSAANDFAPVIATAPLLSPEEPLLEPEPEVELPLAADAVLVAVSVTSTVLVPAMDGTRTSALVENTLTYEISKYAFV